MQTKFYIPVSLVAEDMFNETCFVLRKYGLDSVNKASIYLLVKAIVNDTIYRPLEWTNSEEETTKVLESIFEWWVDKTIVINVDGLDEEFNSYYNRAILDRYEFKIRDLMEGVLKYTNDNPCLLVHTTEYKNDIFVEIGADYRVLEFEKQRNKKSKKKYVHTTGLSVL